MLLQNYEILHNFYVQIYTCLYFQSSYLYRNAFKITYHSPCTGIETSYEVVQ